MDNSEYNSKHYTELFGGKSGMDYYRSMHLKIKRSIAMFGRMEGCMILDIGCGDG